MQEVQSVTGATLQVETIDLSGKQLKMGEGPYKGKLVKVVGIVPRFYFANLVIQLESGQFMTINPDHLVGYNGDGKEANVQDDLPEVFQESRNC